MFDNNFGKCGPISTFFQQLICKKIFYVYIRKISTSPAICFYTTLSNKNVIDFDSIFNKLLTYNIAEDTLNTWFNI